MQLGMQVSSRRSTAGVILAVAALALSALTVRAPDATAGPPAAAEEDWVETTLASMTLEEKVGQLFVTYVYGSTADTRRRRTSRPTRRCTASDNAEQLIDKYHVGGIIYFAWTNNVQNPPQIAGLSNGLQDAALSQRRAGPVPDRHRPGGRHRRPDRAAGDPAAGQHGARCGPQHRRRADRRRDQRRRAAGDRHQLELRPRRRRQRQPGQPGHRRPLVRREPEAGRQPHRRRRSPATPPPAWPARPSTSPATATPPIDSHFGLPVIDHTRAAVGARSTRRRSRPPSTRASTAIMTAHISVPALDPSGDPATLSEPIITGILREELGYDGVVITDALDMAGRPARRTATTGSRCWR